MSDSKRWLSVLLPLSLACSKPPPTPEVLAAPSPWEQRLGQQVTVQGIAKNAKLGAVLETSDGLLWLDGVLAWPEQVLGQQVSVSGMLNERHDLPVYVQEEGAPARSGIPLEEGTDLHQASQRFLLQDPSW